MRFLSTVVAALCAAAVSAQSSNNAILIPEGQSTLDVTAGEPLTLQWSNPSSGTVTIKLQQDPITPDSGIVLASNVPASDKTATVQIPAADEVNSHLYTIEIIDDTDSSNINFSPNFGIKGATGTQTGTASTASSTGTARTSSHTGYSNSTTTSDSSSSSGTASGKSSSAATSSGSSDSSSSGAHTTGASKTATQTGTATGSSAGATETTSVPNSNNSGAGSLKVQGGLLAMAVGLVAVI
ncbi:hypothetical protein HRR83_001067 [Exophiala dermatitidis]|uniref:Yeast cell wall synthesis Kre9/Knh1-like N-terminal domain-containing protein n=2 Tax=Exophiala dermatitidis TaxID=5970 RepID=H6C7G1_EXODN|nr:uncharacterized protein HMPREF1120_07642 [Exophiala dermatitidis NIH/UT8656]KAJ4522582.1 hypothetical protein HRR75_000976 [Exophiala dermatitidis]EHY59657.1 hypothetical protein HMPREF1120_07642 [Exophiala dermatitidis NIH/UT8656]KAJ4525878.1 hypothetical protein HRR74_001071 [Exophiala dermatitidis]KAJ4527175.1 hypothetical protein HRR73_001972 [Exophiala dermatitidis]KAJ4532897.1 hypothetical protein HRR76_007873 [Exophiala dermatitidis]